LTARVEGCLWDKRLVEDKKARSVGELEESVATAPQMQMAYARLFFFGGGVGQDKLIKGIVFQNARAYAPSGTSHHGIRFAA
jgi:hypothetical protein